MSPAQVVLEEQSALPVLIIDKQGDLAEGLVRSLATSLKVIFVSNKKIYHPKVLHVPYTRSLPRIPHTKFSAIIVISQQQKDLHTFLPELSEKATECAVPLLYITNIYTFSQSIHANLTKIPNLQLILVGDVLGLQESRLDALIADAKVKEKVLLPDTGLTTHYPTPYQLFLEHVISLAFSPVSAFVYEPICLFSKTPMTEIAFTRIIQHALPHVKIDFVKQKVPAIRSYIPSPATYLTYDSHVISDWIRSDSRQLVERSPKKRPRTSGFKKRIKVGAVICGILILTPLAISGACSVYARMSISWMEGSIKAGNIEAVYSQAQKTATALSTAEGAILIYSPVKPLLAAPYTWYTHTIRVGREVSTAVSQFAHAGIQIKSSIKTERQTGNKERFVQGITEAGEALLSMQKLLAQGDLPGSIASRLEPYQATITYLSAIRETLPELVGFDGEKTYLVLLQNQTELRPGGGFIGSFALVKVDRGEVVETKIYDVYDADGQLQGHVEPPFFLRRYMGASHWYLRDSNASVLFAENGKQALFFLEKELNVKADGVIAVNAQVIQDVMQVIGSITIPEYKQEITAENVIEQTQDHAEKNFFPGSTQKKDFLNAYQKALMSTLNGNQTRIPQVVALLGKEIQQKHIQTYFPKTSLEEVFVSAGSGGGIPMVQENEGSFSDVFGISEANIGQNKSNRYVERKIDQQLKLGEDGEVAESVTVTYTNRSTKTSPYGGDYTQFLRFVLPKQARLDTIQVDGKDQSTIAAVTDPAVYTRKTFLPPTELEIETVGAETYQTVGFLLIVPQGGTKKVTISYTQQVTPPAQAFTYIRNMVKQSGTTADQYTLTMVLPDGYIATDNTLERGQQIGNMVQSKGTLDTDKRLAIKLVKKKN